MAAKKRSGLGRDLDVLLGNPETDTPEGEGELRLLKLTSLQAGKYQPRKAFDEEPLQELVASIREVGVLDPILVRAVAPQRFEEFRQFDYGYGQRDGIAGRVTPKIETL